MRKSIFKIISNPPFAVTIFIFLYFFTFFFYSLKRLQMLWASYFDLGIMHQTVWNTYKAMQTFDFSRILMLTDPHGSGMQIYRMAIHADYAMAAVAPFYFINSGPETLLFVQTAVLASGAVAIYFITNKIENNKSKKVKILSIVFPILYLMNFAVQRTNYYEFHAVTLATAIILWMFAAYIYKKYWLAFFLGLFAILTKEQVGFSIGIFLFIEAVKSLKFANSYNSVKNALSLLVNSKTYNKRFFTFLLLSFFSFFYVIITVFYIMPYFRQGNDHFALSYFTKSESKNIADLLGVYFGRLFSLGALKYVATLLGAVLFIPVFSVYLLPVLPEVLMNLISESSNMRNFYYHYTAVITPWIFIALIYSTKNILRKWNSNFLFYFYIFLLLFCTFYTSFLESPLPYSKRGGNLFPLSQAKEQMDIHMWQQVLSDDRIAVSSTGQFSPYLSGRKYFYDFGENYVKADYVMIRKNEIYNYPEKKKLIPIYEDLVKDKRFIKIYTREDVEVYKKEIM